MNLYDVVNRGIKLSGVTPPPSAVRAKLVEQKRGEAISKARDQWINAMQADQARAWMDLGTAQKDVLVGLASILTLAGICKVYDTGSQDSYEVRVIRGAISNAQQCAKGGHIINRLDANAFHAATTAAISVFHTCSDFAVEQAALHMHAAVHGGADATDPAVA